MADKWLLIGGDSEIGAATLDFAIKSDQPVLATTRRQDVVSPSRPYLDLAQPLESWRPPQQVGAACIFAAVARLAACHSDPVGSAHINVGQTIALVERLLEQDIHVLYLSTNQVFDGETPFVAAEAALNPVSEYGRQKAQTETVLHSFISEGAPIAILRLAKVVSPSMPLIADWADALSKNRAIKAFSDMAVAPTPIDTVVAAISAIMESKSRGVFQLTGSRDVSYLEAGQYIAQCLGADANLVTSARAMDANAAPGATPKHTTLDSTHLRDRFGILAADPWTVFDRILEAQHPV
jgi:dTDP-4-dehydrorhamnose reductase